VLIFDPDKAGEVAVETVLKVAPKRNKFSIIPDLEEIKAAGAACSACNECIRACPNNQPIPEAMKAAAEGDFDVFADILDDCIGCARCDSACPKDFPLHSFMVKAGEL
jgi:acetyl-CoA decarbonylase/synthase complex subunit alpha